ncbi:carboxymuconolactone decarboxylase family protein [Candidatus Bipolaricaulota bacterium]|nr:carboxymuconolactone decarboxylase family protein [Candidatus Bipolaricaulota bacterium]TFH10874.1 MAG: carboxymuconolactone decarboxylase family protein [Candidatus Atribacteria bacterium]
MPYPLTVFESLDRDLLNRHEQSMQFTFEPGVLSKKVKLLMAMAIDSALGTPHGVKSLAEQAIEAGATKEEVAETVRVAVYVGGAFSIYNLGRGLDELF